MIRKKDFFKRLMLGLAFLVGNTTCKPGNNIDRLEDLVDNNVYNQSLITETPTLENWSIPTEEPIQRSDLEYTPIPETTNIKMTTPSIQTPIQTFTPISTPDYSATSTIISSPVYTITATPTIIPLSTSSKTPTPAYIPTVKPIAESTITLEATETPTQQATIEIDKVKFRTGNLDYPTSGTTTDSWIAYSDEDLRSLGCIDNLVGYGLIGSNTDSGTCAEAFGASSILLDNLPHIPTRHLVDGGNGNFMLMRTSSTGLAICEDASTTCGYIDYIQSSYAVTIPETTDTQGKSVDLSREILCTTTQAPINTPTPDKPFLRIFLDPPVIRENESFFVRIEVPPEIKAIRIENLQPRFLGLDPFAAIPGKEVKLNLSNELYQKTGISVPLIYNGVLYEAGPFVCTPYYERPIRTLIIDDSSEGNVSTGWEDNGEFHTKVATSRNSFIWNLNGAPNSAYSLFVKIPTNSDGGTAVYKFKDFLLETRDVAIQIDQSANSGQWVNLGIHRKLYSSLEQLTLEGTGVLYADQVKLEAIDKNWFHYDINSPPGVRLERVGNLVFTKNDGIEEIINTTPRIFVIDNQIPHYDITQRAQDIFSTSALVNIIYGSETQKVITETNGNMNVTNKTIPQRIQEVFGDNYDFYLMFSSDMLFSFPLEDRPLFGYTEKYICVKNNIAGIPQKLFDYSDEYRSQGKLRGLILLDNGKAIESRQFAHAFEHAWVGNRLAELGISEPEEDRHFSSKSNVGSMLGGFSWLQRENGLYLDALENFNQGSQVSPLIGYFMSQVPASQVPDIKIYSDDEKINNHIVNSGIFKWNAVPIPEETIQSLRIEEIIARWGEVTPQSPNIKLLPIVESKYPLSQSAMDLFSHLSYWLAMDPSNLTTVGEPARTLIPIGYNWVPLKGYYYFLTFRTDVD